MKTDIPIKAGDRCFVHRAPDVFQVRVMAVAEGYAMVRRPRAMPFVISLNDLDRVDAGRS